MKNQFKKKSGCFELIFMGAAAVTFGVTLLGTMIVAGGVPAVASIWFNLDQNAKRRKFDLEVAQIQKDTWYSGKQTISKKNEGAN